LQVAQAVESFDFDGALDLLRRHEPAVNADAHADAN
jgi:hypothetical protein